MKEENTVITTVKIDRSKRDLAKAKGLKLQEILDIALDNVLKLESLSNMDILKEKEETIKELAKIESDKKESINKLNNELKEIKEKIKETNKKYDIKISELNLKIATLEENTEIDPFAIARAKLEKEAPVVYKKLLQDYIKSGGDYKDPEIFSRINDYALRYENTNYGHIVNKLDKDWAELRENKRNL